MAPVGGCGTWQRSPHPNGNEHGGVEYTETVTAGGKVNDTMTTIFIVDDD